MVSTDLETPSPIDKVARAVQASELRDPLSDVVTPLAIATGS